ncbi:glycoside hydrolase family 128 protein [Apiospora kogelbergensis]|uniref:Glycoside hydrolase family 128 protein n=1 Tax=Apiospora kogelbergensis TaxID=1337665 RepID=A0AAW0QCE4_9PEZI
MGSSKNTTWRDHGISRFRNHLSGEPDGNDNNVKAQSKRGVAYQDGAHKADNRLLFSPESPVAWYYTWSLWPAPEAGEGDGNNVEFLPLVHSTNDLSSQDKADAFRKQLDGLPKSSTHLLTFNEPDGDTGSGGSAIEPEDAARVYMDRIAPLRSGDGRTWNISHPSVTGSPRGLDWLRRFNESCWDLDRKQGCPTDFVAVHWYGEFEGLSGWLDTLHGFYNSTSSSEKQQLKFWVTEMALPQQDDEATLRMMNQTLPYLDGLDYVDGYAWFGAFRKGEKANEWTGDQVSLFDKKGGLTELGSLYLSSGGPDHKDGGGFEPGKKGPPGKDDDEGVAANVCSVSRWAAVLSGVLVAASLVAF